MQKRRNIPTRLVVDIPEQLRKEIKLRALSQGMTLRRWILKSIALKIQQEDRT